jgi:hypothetical protein
MVLVSVFFAFLSLASAASLGAGSLRSFFPNRTSLQDLQPRNDIPCRVPEGYYVFAVKAVESGSITTFTGGVYLEQSEHTCRYRLGAVSICGGSDRNYDFTQAATAASNSGLQPYSSASSDISFAVIGTSILDPLPVIVVDDYCGMAYMGKLVRSYLADDDFDAYLALKKAASAVG